jgi:hypothetical protein
VLVLVDAVVAAILVVGTVLFRDAARVAVVVSAGIAVFFGYRHVAVLTDDLAIAGRPVQLLWAALGIGALLIAWRGGAVLRTTTRALNAIGAGLVIVALVAIVPHELGELGRPTAATGSAARPELSPDPGAEPLRDIWILVFDRYGSAESLRLNYGIEERLTPWLSEHGFHVTPNAHANYSRTSLSLSSVLNLDYLDALPPGSAAERLRDHAAGRFLTDLGYRYVHIGSIFGPTRSSALATDNPLLENTSDFATALFDSTLASTIVRWVSRSDLDPRRQRQADWARFQLDRLDETVDMPGPKFVFAHLLLPHPPYVFDADGELVSDAADERRSRSEAYEAQMTYLDSRIKQLLEPMLARPETERPIVVVMADEGPYPERYEGNPLIAGPDPDFDWSTATDSELRIKFGILHAMLLPGAEADRIPDGLTSVNTLRLIFNEYFDSDLPLLPDRILIPGPAGHEPVEVSGRLGLETDR